MIYSEVNKLIDKRSFFQAEKLLNETQEDTAIWHYYFSKLLLAKAWFDEAKFHLIKAYELDKNNENFKEDLISLMSRHRSYSDHYDHGYRRHKGCACCCCDDCCCDCNVSCCDLICLDSCCECMGGDLIECI